MKYLDTSLPAEERTQDLLSRMNMQDKIAQLGSMFFIGTDTFDWEEIAKNSPGHIGLMVQHESHEKLAEDLDKIQNCVMRGNEWKIPALIHVEAITGGLFSGATSFPTSITQACTWHPELIERMANQIRQQLIAVGIRHALSPVFDIGRDPRWGRLTETYGEDETLASALAVAFVRGLQGQNDTQGVAATGKHFVGHGVTEGGLFMSQNPITERELREVHAKPFQAAITEAGLMGVMNSYCSINREPITASKRIMTDLLRDEMKFDGILVSDYFAIDRLLNPYQIVDTRMDAGLLALKAGLDVEYPFATCYNEKLLDAIKDGRLDAAMLDRSASRVLNLKFRLGLFEAPYSARQTIQVSFSAPENEQICSELAMQSPILLKNEGGILPLSKNVKRVAVVGPHAHRVRSLFGEYSYAARMETDDDDMNNMRAKNRAAIKMPDGLDIFDLSLYQESPGDIRETPIHVEDKIREKYPQAKTLFESIRDYLPDAQVTTARGISYTGNNLSGYEDALACAANADVVILTLGGQNGWGLVSTNGEGVDNSNIGLPGKQEQFARDIHRLGKKTVVVHMDGRALSNEFVVSHFDAIFELWQPGQIGFEPFVRLLFGQTSPSGKLPLTVARGADRLPAYYGMPRGSGYVSAGRFGVNMNPNGYVNATAHPLFYFGHGLSYTRFEYANLQLETCEVPPDGQLSFTVDVRNSGKMNGDEIVQVYIADQLSSMVRPDMQMIGFKRLPLKIGETKTLRFSIRMSELAFLDENMRWKVEEGKMTLLVGSSCMDIRLRDEFTILDDLYIDGATRGFFAKAEIIVDCD